MKNTTAIRIIRFFCLLISGGDYAIMTYAGFADETVGPFFGFLKSYSYFTTWGMFFTLCNNITQIFVHPDVPRSAKLSDKHSPW